MYILTVEERNLSLKAKQLRKQSIIPLSVDGGDLTETMLLQVALGDANKLLRSKSKGGMVMLDVAGKKFSTILKEISYNATSGLVENLSCQKLMEDEVIHGTVKVVLINRDKTPLMVQQLLEEIPYRALPSQLVETLEIDIGTMGQEHSLKLEDLPFAKNKGVEILLPGDTVVVSLVENSKSQQADEEVTPA